MTAPDDFVPEGDMWFKHILDTLMWLLDMTFMRWWLAIPAFYGDFEAAHWYMKSINHLLPEPVRPEIDGYINRDQGVIFSFRNTSYTPPPSNWTDPTGGAVSKDGKDAVTKIGSSPRVESSSDDYYHLNFTDIDTDFSVPTQLSNPFDFNGDNIAGLGDGWFSYLGRSEVKGWWYGNYI